MILHHANGLPFGKLGRPLVIHSDTLYGPIYLSNSVQMNTLFLSCLYAHHTPGLYTADHFSNFPYAKWDSQAFSLNLVMTGWHAFGISQVPNASYTDKTGGGLALSHWKELTTRIPTSFRDNPYAKEYPCCLPLQLIELSAFLKLQPGMPDYFL